MGTDIHLFAEKVMDSTWVPLQRFNWYTDDAGEWYSIPDEDELYIDRDYHLFAFLAGVRDDEQTQKFPLKGIPEDANEEIRKAFKLWSHGAHSASFLTLTELKSIDWDNDTISYTGMMAHAEALKLTESLLTESPRWDLLDDLAEWMGPRMKNPTEFTIDVPIQVLFRSFYEKVVMGLDDLKGDLSDDQIRIVFWFDN